MGWLNPVSYLMMQSSQSHEICLNEGSVNLPMNNPLQKINKVNSSNITHVVLFSKKYVIWLFDYVSPEQLLPSH